MENQMQLFENIEFGKLEVVMINDKPYFPATECAKALGYAKPENAILRHCKGSLKRGVLSNGGFQEKKYIPEGDLYRLIIRSKLPAAERFESWIFDEVLPAVRKNGAYITESALTKMLQSSELLALPRPQLSECNSAARLIVGVLKAANVPPEEIAITIARIYDPLGISVSLEGMSGKTSFSATDIARINGMMSASGRPHFLAVSAIISILGIDDGHKIIKPYQHGDTVTVCINYDEYVLNAVTAWVDDNCYPYEIPAGNKTYKVKYKHLEEMEDIE